jgi:hypothetical protein
MLPSTHKGGWGTSWHVGVGRAARASRNLSKTQRTSATTGVFLLLPFP